MNVAYSPTAGILVSSTSDSLPEIYYLTESEELSDLESLYLLSTIQDWQVLELENGELGPVIQNCTLDYWVSRVQSLIICMIEGVTDHLAVEVLEHVENALQTHCSVEAVLNRLLIAPLKDRRRVEELATLALGDGLSSTAGLLDKLSNLQPLLRRFAATWLQSPTSEFVDLPVPREEFWQHLIRQSLLPKLLEAADSTAFSNVWSALAFVEPNVTARRAIARLGNFLAGTVFPTSIRHVEPAYGNERFPEALEATSRQEGFRSYKAYQRAVRQVNAIAEAVAAGKDAKATRYLNQLIDDQVKSSTREQLVKSLCNIAQKCACMFRADFERQCLERALQIDPDDEWALTQMGNHLKRVGEYEEAVTVLSRAVPRHAPVAMASIADVWREAGEYRKAEEFYKGISGWEDLVAVRTGLADIKRYTGKFSDALLEYERILEVWPNADRAVAGKAEIYRRLGRLDEAISLYDSLIYDPSTVEPASVIFRLAKVAVLKQANRLAEAFSLVDEVVRTAPFYMGARIQRGSLLVLLGDEAKGLASIPRSGVPRAFGTWITQYYRGLVLLKLNRYREAQELLVNRLGSALLASDNQTILRLGAAFALLCVDNLDFAGSVLSQISDVRDYYTEYVYHVLELHLSVARKDHERAAEVARRLESVREMDEAVNRVISALRENDFSAAKRYELELLLRVAA